MSLHRILCAECGNWADRACKGCMSIGYCSQECQAADWSAGHHHECDIGARFLSKRKKKTVDADGPQRVVEGQVSAETCLVAPSSKVSFVGDVDTWEQGIFAAKKVKRLLYGNTLEGDIILNQVMQAHHGACSDELARSLHLHFGNDRSLLQDQVFAWSNIDETQEETQMRTGTPVRLPVNRISHGEASKAVLALIASRGFTGSNDIEVFDIQLSPDTRLNFEQALAAGGAVKGKIYLRARVRVRVAAQQNNSIREFLLKGQMTKLPRKGQWWLWVVEGRAVTPLGELDRFKEKPVHAALVLKARIEKDGHTIVLPSMYFIIGT